MSVVVFQLQTKEGLLLLSHASETSEERSDRPLHRAGELPVLARTGSQRHPAVLLRADPHISAGEPLHHRWIQSLPALQAVYQKVQSRYGSLYVSQKR